MATLVHSKKLYVKNRYRSPFLRLPTEIIHVLSFVMEDTGAYPVWRPISITRHHIRRIMCKATALRWKGNVSLGRDAVDVLTRSKGNPRVVVAQFGPWDEEYLKAVDSARWSCSVPLLVYLASPESSNIHSLASNA